MSYQLAWRLYLGLSLAILVVLIGGKIAAWKKNTTQHLSLNQDTLPSVTLSTISGQAVVLPPTVSAGSSGAMDSPVTPLPASTASASLSSISLPARVNLPVPFVLQAPLGRWDKVHEEFCEEASVLMAISYVNHKNILPSGSAEHDLQTIKSFEEKRFGYYTDTTIEEVADIFREHYHYVQVQAVSKPTIITIKRALVQGQLVLVPAAGRLLGNPYFQQPGPIYHMLVIKGYTGDGQFITNDPGTRHGANYLYKEDVIMNAMHNWRADGLIELGPKVILVIR